MYLKTSVRLGMEVVWLHARCLQADFKHRTIDTDSILSTTSILDLDDQWGSSFVLVPPNLAGPVEDAHNGPALERSVDHEGL